MTQEEMKKEFHALYDLMANSNKVENMHVFGEVHKEMMDWLIANKPDLAQEWLEKLESIKWKNYLTPKEAQKIVDNMNPKAPWSREQWATAMQQHGFALEKEPCYNRCALWVTMNMVMSDSSETILKYVDNGNLFKMVFDLATDKLQDKDNRFSIRRYFDV